LALGSYSRANSIMGDDASTPRTAKPAARNWRASVQDAGAGLEPTFAQ
jgi:hypothetical protein